MRRRSVLINRIRRVGLGGLAVTLLALGATGCAGPWPSAGGTELEALRSWWKLPDVRLLREERQAAVEAEFDARRDAAQLALARDYLRLGEPIRAEETVGLLLARRPNHPEGQALLAEIKRTLEFADRPSPRRVGTAALRDLRRDPLRHDDSTLPAELSAAGKAQRATTSAKPTPAGAEPAAYDAPLRLMAPDADPLAEPADAAAEPDPVRAAELLRQGRQALAEGKLDTARVFLARAVAHAADDEPTAVSIAVLPLRHAQPELSAKLAEQALRNHPRAAALYRTLGLARYRTGDYEAAQVALRQSVALDEAQPLAYFLMGCCLRKQGRDEAARRWFDDAARLDPRFDAKRAHAF